jgi:hypothetical protein
MSCFRLLLSSNSAYELLRVVVKLLLLKNST